MTGLKTSRLREAVKNKIKNEYFTALIPNWQSCRQHPTPPFPSFVLKGLPVENQVWTKPFSLPSVESEVWTKHSPWDEIPLNVSPWTNQIYWTPNGQLDLPFMMSFHSHFVSMLFVIRPIHPPYPPPPLSLLLLIIRPTPLKQPIGLAIFPPFSS